jgi:hypothetical protein
MYNTGLEENSDSPPPHTIYDIVQLVAFVEVCSNVIYHVNTMFDTVKRL